MENEAHTIGGKVSNISLTRQHILPYLDIDIKSFQNRDAGDDHVTLGAAAAIREHKVGI